MNCLILPSLDDSDDGKEIPVVDSLQSDPDTDTASEGEIPLGYNPITGEVYQNQMADPLVRGKMHLQW